MAIVQIAVTIFIFTTLFLIFAFFNTNQKVGIWIVMMILFSFIIGTMTTGSHHNKYQPHPSYLIAQYSKYNSKDNSYTPLS